MTPTVSTSKQVSFRMAEQLVSQCVYREFDCCLRCGLVANQGHIVSQQKRDFDRQADSGTSNWSLHDQLDKLPENQIKRSRVSLLKTAD